MALNARQLLCKHVRSAQTTDDIIPLLRLMPLDAIQDTLLDVIRVLDTETANKIQYKCLSSTDILPDDLTQHIVSFTDSLGIKCINKAFNNCYNKNKELELKQRQYIVDKHAFNPAVKYEEHNQTWIIHPTRTHLNSEEIANGYNGPLNDLKDAIETVQSGDKLLFYDGHYIQTCDFDLDLCNIHDLQFIGEGNHVVLTLNHQFVDIHGINKFL
eukprot:925818_1